MSTNFHLNFNGWALIAVKVMRIFSDLYHGKVMHSMILALKFLKIIKHDIYDIISHIKPCQYSSMTICDH